MPGSHLLKSTMSILVRCSIFSSRSMQQLKCRTVLMCCTLSADLGLSPHCVSKIASTCLSHLHADWQELLQQGQWWQQLGSHEAALKQYEALLAAAQDCSVHDRVSACRGAAQCCAAMGQLRQVQI